MTLLELLKEHLKEWPENVRCLSQDVSGEINENTFDLPEPKSSMPRGKCVWPHTEWSFKDNPEDRCSIWCLPTADDARTAIVTREMWEAA
ncbi:hypothetical protein [Metapseudomonas otitidis]|uniref:hypothetical protein n=1 Tax=Metapseudomonas otitidis TaxID=319939 RepID=UPI0024489685|nr:hypothetical protein [Pseudomonas otitidis]MDG9785248.1 hypothetical protein [Pseudomonas otitidis]